MDIEPTVVIEIDEGRTVSPAGVRNLHFLANLVEFQIAAVEMHLASSNKGIELIHDWFWIAVARKVCENSGPRLGIHIGAIEIDIAVVVDIAASRPHRAEIRGLVDQGLFLKRPIMLIDQ